MNEYLVTAGVVFVALTAGFLLLLQYGVTVVSYLAISFILLSLILALLYTWMKSKSDKTVEKFKLEILHRIRREISNLEEDLKKASELLNVEPFLSEIERLRREMIEKGFMTGEFEINRTKVEKITLTKVEQESRKINQQLRSLEALATAGYKEKLDRIVEKYNRAIETLSRAGFNIAEEVQRFNMAERRQTKSLAEILEKKEELETLFEGIIDGCIEECHHLISIAGDISDAEEIDDLREVRKLREPEDKALELARIKKKLLPKIEEPFTQKRREIESYITRAEELLNRDFSAEESRDFRSLQERLEKVKQAKKFAELEQLAEQAKIAGLDAIQTLSKKITKLREELNLEPREQEISLPAEGDMTTLFNKILFHLEQLVKELEEVHIASKLASSYKKVEPIIDRILAEKGSVSAEDLKIKYAEKFLERYAELHRNTEFKDGKLVVK